MTNDRGARGGVGDPRGGPGDKKLVLLLVTEVPIFPRHSKAGLEGSCGGGSRTPTICIILEVTVYENRAFDELLFYLKTIARQKSGPVSIC